MKRNRIFAQTAVLSCLIPFGAGAADVRAAVAANFTGPMAKLSEAFRAQTGHHVLISSGSSAKLATQIRNGAPFAVFLSADQDEPLSLIKDRAAVDGSQFTYAVGKLVLWSPIPGLVDSEGSALRSGRFKYLAIANPKLAPYGKAANLVIDKLGLTEKLAKKLITGENISQTHQFVSTGNAELGFMALSQLKKDEGSRWIVPQSFYPPLRQDAVLLAKGKSDEAAQAFLNFLKSEKAQDIIKEFGYDKP